MEELKNKVANLENLSKKVDKIEYVDIKELRQEMQDIKVDLTKNNVLTEQNTEAMTSMSKTMESVRSTMIDISTTNRELANNLKQQNNKIDRLQLRQDRYDENIEFMKKEIEQNEDKGKFDIILFLKQNFVGIIISCGILSYLFLK